MKHCKIVLGPKQLGPKHYKVSSLLIHMFFQCVSVFVDKQTKISKSRKETKGSVLVRFLFL